MGGAIIDTVRAGGHFGAAFEQARVLAAITHWRSILRRLIATPPVTVATLAGVLGDLAELARQAGDSELHTIASQLALELTARKGAADEALCNRLSQVFDHRPLRIVGVPGARN